MRTVRYGCSWTRSNCDPLNGPGRDQIWFDTPMRPRSWTWPARRVSATASASNPAAPRGLSREPGHRARMSKCERAFQVDEVAQRDECRVQRLFVHPVAVGRLAQRGRPGVAGLRAGQDRVGVPQKDVGDPGVELAAEPGADHGHRPGHAVAAVVHLDHVGQLRDAHLDRDVLAAGAGGQPAAVVALEGVGEGGLYVGPKPIRSASRAADAQCEWINREI